MNKFRLTEFLKKVEDWANGNIESRLQWRFSSDGYRDVLKLIDINRKLAEALRQIDLDSLHLTGEGYETAIMAQVALGKIEKMLEEE